MLQTNVLQAGFARVNVTPMMGINIRGYYITRLAEAVLDELEINALAVSDGNTKIVLLSLDSCGISRKTLLPIREHVAKVNDLPTEAVYIHTTHTHTGPNLEINTEDQLEKEYYQFVLRRMADVAGFALKDLKPAKMGYGIGQAPKIGFIRRFRMKDGSTQTNPGINNPDIAGPIGEVDERVNVLRFDRECGDHLVLVNYGNHPDVIGGNKISADWPGFLRKEVEKGIDNCKCIFFNGCQGDINHINVHPTLSKEDWMSASGEGAGYEHSKYMARALAGTVLQVYDKTKYLPVTSVRCKLRTIQIPTNMPTPEDDMAEAHRIDELYLAGKIHEVPGEAMMKVTIMAEAHRLVELEHGPAYYDMDISAIAIGNIVFIGMPGEGFTGIGVELKKAPGWDLILPTVLTNGSQGYFPMQDAYDEGGYEAKTSRFKPGIAEIIIEEGKKLMAELAE
ncbi:MAG: hypothetical protein E7293_11835 [Lachnospiraceae bacterium]|nr:hypothetical protein [Lachnospiraceae bacterium]